jgi:hypothetical protein
MNVFTRFEMTAMWNLNGNDIQKAKEQLEARRTTLKAEYEEEMKRIDTELADIDTVERVAVNFVSGRKSDDAPPKAEAEPEKAADKESSPFDGAAEMKSSMDADKPADISSDPHDKPANGPAEQKGSRWRMRLGTVSETEAAD